MSVALRALGTRCLHSEGLIGHRYYRFGINLPLQDCFGYPKDAWIDYTLLDARTASVSSASSSSNALAFLAAVPISSTFVKSAPPNNSSIRSRESCKAGKKGQWAIPIKKEDRVLK